MQRGYRLVEFENPAAAEMIMPEKKQALSHIALIACFALLAMSSSFYNGITSGNDSHQHYQFAQTIQASIRSGEIYPSLAHATNHGYGDVGLRFYPPLVYYVLSIFSLLFGSWYAATLITFTLIFFVSGVGVYLWAREELPAAQSLLAAALFIFAPYHLNQIYNGSLFAEFAACAVVPFCFLFVTRVCRKGTAQDVLGLSIAYALLILTHLPMTIIGSLVFVIYSLVLIERKSFVRTSLKLAVSVGCALAATLFYWLRMATELDWVNHSAKTYFREAFDYRTNFLLVPAHILNFKTDTSVLWLADSMLLAVLLVSIPSIIYLLKRRKNLSAATKAVTLVLLVSVFLTTPLSSLVWDNCSLLQKIQFPWRWLGIVSMSGAIFASIGIIKAAEKMKQSKNPLLPIGLGFVFLFFVTVSSFIAKEAVFHSPQEFNQEIAAPDAQSFECWWTIWAKPEAFETTEKIVAGDRSYEIKNWQPLEREIIIAAGKPAAVRVAAFYYPHWQATVNGERVLVEAANDGAILIPITGSESKIQLVFREPYFVKIANYVSLAIWLVFSFGIIMSLYKSGRGFNSSE